MMQLLINILIAGAQYLLIAVSFSLIYNPGKFFHLAHGATITLGAYMAWLLLDSYKLPLILCIIGAVLFCSLYGVGCELLVYRPIKKRRLNSLALLIASIGLLIITENLMAIVFGNDTKTFGAATGQGIHRVYSAYFTTNQAWSVVLALVIFTAVSLLINLSFFGKSLRAVASNAELCDVWGISVRRTMVWAFLISSAIAGLTGILSGFDINFTPTSGFNLLIYGIVAMIIGGVGNEKGLLPGALLVAVVQQSVGYFIDTKWIDAVTYLFLIIFLVFKPLGFSGKLIVKTSI